MTTNLPAKAAPGRAVISESGELAIREGLKGKTLNQNLRHMALTKAELNEDERTYVQRARAYCEAALKPATAKDAFTLLERLRLSKQMPNMGDDDYRLWLQDFRSDIERLPVWAVELACERYRRQANERFFPHCGTVLVDLVRHELRQWHEAKQSVEELERLL